MTQIVVAQRMWQRRDTAANWAAKNPVLAAGEIGVELGATTADPQKFKIGNGVTPWNTLAYAGGAGGGSVWRDGSGVPSNSLGNDGDYYLRTSNGDVYAKSSGTYSVVGNIRGPAGATGATGAAGPPGPSSSCFPTANFDGGTGDIQVGAFCDLYVPFEFEITKSTLTVDPAGTLEVDIRVTPFASHPADPGDSICASARPSVVGGSRQQDATLTGWTTVVPSGSMMRFIITACTGVRKANLVLEGVRDA